MHPQDHSKPDTKAYRAATDMLLSWNRPLLISHERPDGDAIGCLIAMKTLLDQLGEAATVRRTAPVRRTVTAMIYEPCPKRYANLDGADDLHVMTGPDDPALTEADGFVLMDTCSYAQLRPIEAWLREASVPRIVVDHHVTRDTDVVGSHGIAGSPTSVLLIDPAAAAASVILYRWAKSAGWQVSPRTAKALFAGVTADTGWFQHSNTTAEVFGIAAELVESGASADQTHQQFYLNEPASKLRLRGAALNGVELLRDSATDRNDAIAVICVPADMLTRAGATPADTEDLVNAPMVVESVELSILLVESAPDLVKCSFRSKGKADVARLAASFGGGGHVRAAGARIAGTLESVKAAVLKRIADRRTGEESEQS